ncbi:MAG: aminotransferase class IV, partial [Anaerolineae bacterium]
GIVWDSEAASEYEECRVKTAVLGRKRPSFDLLESLLWTPQDGYFLLDRHLARLADSAVYFGFEMSRTAVRQRLLAFARNLTAPSKVRLTLAKTGAVRVTAEDLATEGTEIAEKKNLGNLCGSLKVDLAREPVDAGNLFLYHKTTFREMYAAARDGRPECGEVILWNERGEITEATTANVVVELDGRLWTPPVDSGLLAGTLRAQLLADGQIGERIITLDEFRRAARLWLINSVRGWRRAVTTVAVGG